MRLIYLAFIAVMAALTALPAAARDWRHHGGGGPRWGGYQQRHMPPPRYMPRFQPPPYYGPPRHYGGGYGYRHNRPYSYRFGPPQYRPWQGQYGSRPVMRPPSQYRGYQPRAFYNPRSGNWELYNRGYR